jgi:membrane-bound lytic murein transglycosylase A
MVVAWKRAGVSGAAILSAACRLFPLFLTVFVVVSCTLFIQPPHEPALEKLSDRAVKAYRWEDDLELAGLSRAVRESVRYYERLPGSYRFQYGAYSYSPEEMVLSMRLFLSILENSRGAERMSQLREKFLIYESKDRQGGAFFTGYYEPILDGVREPEGALRTPVYETPDDLIGVNLELFSEQWRGESIVGRLEGRQLVPYDSRDEIVDKQSLKDRAGVIAYVDEIELFFLQIQGSGLIRFPDGRVKRINYANKNGHPYRAIGTLLRDRIPEEEMSLQSIKAYLHDHPDEVRDILRYNQSYTFFREVDEGPLGNIGVPLTPKRSIAMDSRIVPKGGLAFIQTEIPHVSEEEISASDPIQRFAVVQDTGGAIRDHGRVDIFFGHEADAALVAGHLKQRGRVFLIVARKEFLGE